jgi:hypothetical protein
MEDLKTGMINYPELFEKRDMAKMISSLQSEVLTLRKNDRNQKAQLFYDLYGGPLVDVDWDKVQYSGKVFIVNNKTITSPSDLPKLEETAYIDSYSYSRIQIELKEFNQNCVSLS